MNKFDILVDSGLNIPQSISREHKLKVIPFTYIVNGEEKLCYSETVDFTTTAKEYYAEIRAGKDCKTTLINAAKFVSYATPSLESGNDVLLITISSGVSGTFSQAAEAQKALQEKYPERKIIVHDSANASMGAGLQAIKVAEFREMGKSIEECEQWLKENAYRYNSYLIVDDLKYLKRGGRISTTLAFAGTLLNIKPVLIADASPNAKLVSSSKERGKKKAIDSIVATFKKRVDDPANTTVAIAHADCEQDAQRLEELLRECGVKDIIVEYYDLCTGAHVGPGAIAMFYYGKDRRPEATTDDGHSKNIIEKFMDKMKK